jgi:hypothetical protein
MLLLPANLENSNTLNLGESDILVNSLRNWLGVGDRLPLEEVAEVVFHKISRLFLCAIGACFFKKNGVYLLGACPLAYLACHSSSSC